ncbi:MAG: histidine phosphatase family protein [Chthoniobacterales bacterium]
MALKQSSKAAWLGLDLGTQSVRAMVVSGAGETLAAGSHKLTSRRDGPRHEQDPEEWWRAISAACQAAFAELPTSFTVQGVAVDGTSGTILLVDGNGWPLTPGLMYDDSRAVEETKRVNEAGAAVWATLGYNRMQLFSEEMRRFKVDPATYPMPGGEDPYKAAHRAVSALRDISASHPNGRVLVVAHNTLIRLTLCSLFSIPLARYRTVFPGVHNGALTEIRLEHDSAALLQYNCPLSSV